MSSQPSSLAFGRNLPIEQAGSTTFPREDVKRRFEADSCFYFGDQAITLRGGEQVDLHTDPPPALVVDIDLTPPSLDKFPINAALRVAEVWRYNGQRVWFYQLGTQGYTPMDVSAVLDGVTTQDIASFLERGRQTDRQELFDEVRAWARW